METHEIFLDSSAQITQLSQSTPTQRFPRFVPSKLEVQTNMCLNPGGRKNNQRSTILKSWIHHRSLRFQTKNDSSIRKFRFIPFVSWLRNKTEAMIRDIRISSCRRQKIFAPSFRPQTMKTPIQPKSRVSLLHQYNAPGTAPFR